MLLSWTDQLKALVTFKSDLLWLTAAKTAKNHSRCCSPLTWRRRVRNRCRTLSTRHLPPQTAHTNNPGGWGASRRYTVSSGGRPLGCRRHAWTAVHWKTCSSMPLSHIDQPARSCCSNTPLFTELSPCLLYEYSPCPSCSITWVNMNVLNSNMSQIIKCIYKTRDVMTISEGQWKLHWWFAGQEVNKVVIYEGNNIHMAPAWRASGQVLLSTSLTRGCVDGLKNDTIL